MTPFSVILQTTLNRETLGKQKQGDFLIIGYLGEVFHGSATSLMSVALFISVLAVAKVESHIASNQRTL